jgi:hypothetical protein
MLAVGHYRRVIQAVSRMGWMLAKMKKRPLKAERTL